MWFFSIVASAALLLVRSAIGAPPTAIEVVNLSIDGRLDNPLRFDTLHPVLGWQMFQTSDCLEAVCPGDRQTAYEVTAARSVADLQSNHSIWQSGRVNSSAQDLRFQHDLVSRDTVAWHVRVWDALGNASPWSEPATWTVGLLNQADWGGSRWIDYPGCSENQPMPIFVRQFEVPSNGNIAAAYLYLLGVGSHHATVNGENVTDEALAPGYSNYQLSSEYRTYDVKELLQKGPNAIGVSLGNGPAYVRRSVTNTAVCRISPYAWWQSQLKGNGSLVTDVSIGSTSVRLDDTTGYHVGGSINIDTGR